MGRKAPGSTPSGAGRGAATFVTLGCRLNQAESGVIAGALEAAGWRPAGEGERAALCVVHTCCVTRTSDAKSRGALRRAVREHPGAVVVAIGCGAQTSAAALAAIEGVDLVVGNGSKMDLASLLPDGKLPRARVQVDPLPEGEFVVAGEGQRISRCRPCLKIQDGCDGGCSYCAVPLARGRSRSRAFADVMREAEALCRAGFLEVVLTGVDLGSYASGDRGLAELTDAIDSLGVERVRLSSVEPTHFPRGILERMADPGHALVPFLHLPVQSASDRVLAAMRRPYDRAWIADLLRRASSSVPDIVIGVDMLLGTPWETEADFRCSLDFVRDEPVDQVHAFTYSERPGTPAAAEPQLPPELRRRRTAEIRRAGEAKRRLMHTRFLGRRLGVLAEEESGGLWQGHAANGLLVRFPARGDLRNSIVDVTLERSSGQSMTGSTGNQ